MSADKKPVWVDQDAHAILKTYAKLIKKSMVDVASALVLEKLEDLDPGAGLEADASASADKASKEEAAAAAPAPKTSKRSRPERSSLAPEDKDVRYLGGVWLV